ncbi:Maf family protein [Paraconexibacter antarcticus]|uniref:Nucleoside triphosphate pyrophosphatase n=1 Tax=Paraconexibacter antarcticus TaxID=2949664 RepID=A0ABY5DNJ2_9ACTN|nr:nucleoside triphosphate pyrophosphatase [Paraconexibacter antarcticus]UTI62372.1 Maf family protein [Paraconexibacter antarcticus]
MELADLIAAKARASTDPLVLASASPQRRAILEQLGVPFEVRPADVQEAAAGEPEAVARDNALLKATVVAGLCPDRTVLGVDTIVTLDGEIFGKPATPEAAAATLLRLQGREHAVLSGIAVAVGTPGDVPRARVQQTLVRFAPLTTAQIAGYVATGEWRGRAGAYAIQGRGAAIVEEIHGDYLNVVGLPVPALRALLPGLLGV